MSGQFGKTMGELMVEQSLREARLKWFMSRLAVLVLFLAAAGLLKYLLS